jgi:hypothetical protein
MVDGIDGDENMALGRLAGVLLGAQPGGRLLHEQSGLPDRDGWETAFDPNARASGDTAY